MLDLKVLRISKVLYTEESLNLGNTLRCKVYDLIFFIDNEITSLFSLNAHDGIHLGQVFHILTTSHLLGKNIASLIKLG